VEFSAKLDRDFSLVCGSTSMVKYVEEYVSQKLPGKQKYLNALNTSGVGKTALFVQIQGRWVERHSSNKVPLVMWWGKSMV
jgi:hypothetical protein